MVPFNYRNNILWPYKHGSKSGQNIKNSSPEPKVMKCNKYYNANMSASRPGGCVFETRLGHTKDFIKMVDFATL
jgi:hypothetical protein